MPLMDEFREEREQIKKAPLPQKLQYFKDYYLLPTLFIAFVTIVSILLLRSTIFKRPESLYITMINFTAEDAAEENVKKAFESRPFRRRRTISRSTATRISLPTRRNRI